MKSNTTLTRAIVIAVSTVFFVTLFGGMAFLASCPNCDRSLSVWITMFILGIAIVMAAVGWIVGVFGLVRVVKNSFVMIAHVTDSFQDANWSLRFNRFNLIYCPKYLTSKGLDARNEVFKSFGLFMLGMVLWLPLFLVQEFAF